MIEYYKDLKIYVISLDGSAHKISVIMLICKTFVSGASHVNGRGIRAMSSRDFVNWEIPPWQSSTWSKVNDTTHFIYFN